MSSVEEIVPLQDEVDHVAFGLSELRRAPARPDEEQRQARLDHIPDRIQALIHNLQTLELPVAAWFEQVGTDYRELCSILAQRKNGLLTELAA